MPRVSMKLSAKEKKEGRDLRDYMVVPIKGAANRRRAGGAAVLVKKEKKPTPKPKLIAASLVVTTNDVDDVADEIEEWDVGASLDVVKTFSVDQFEKAVEAADGGASGSNVDFVVYEMREIYRAKRGM